MTVGAVQNNDFHVALRVNKRSFDGALTAEKVRQTVKIVHGEEIHPYQKKKWIIPSGTDYLAVPAKIKKSGVSDPSALRVEWEKVLEAWNHYELNGNQIIYLELWLVDFLEAIKNPQFLGFQTKSLKTTCLRLGQLMHSIDIDTLSKGNRIPWTPQLLQDVKENFLKLFAGLGQNEYSSREEICSILGFQNAIEIDEFCSLVEVNKVRALFKKKIPDFSPMVLQYMQFEKDSAVWNRYKLAGDQSIYFETLLLDFLKTIKNPDFNFFPLEGLKIACSYISDLANTKDVREFSHCKRIVWTEPLFQHVASKFNELFQFLEQYKKSEHIHRKDICSACLDIDGFQSPIKMEEFCSLIEANTKETISKVKTAEFSSLVIRFVEYIESNTFFSLADLTSYCEKIITLLSDRRVICRFSCDLIEWDSNLIDLTEDLFKDLLEQMRKSRVDDFYFFEDLQDLGLKEFCEAINAHMKLKGCLG